MGKGDKKSKRGKIFKGTFGVSRPHKVKMAEVASPKTKRKSSAKKKASE